MYQPSACILIINIFSQNKLIFALREQIGVAPAATSRLKTLSPLLGLPTLIASSYAPFIPFGYDGDYL
jgi:hypothetical protein